MTTQLDIYGGEVDHADVTGRSAPFTHSQQEILRIIRQLGAITSTQAGRIVHAHRDNPNGYGAPGCPRCKATERGHCKWAASDGGDAMKRLMERGVVRRARIGVWVVK